MPFHRVAFYRPSENFSRALTLALAPENLLVLVLALAYASTQSGTPSATSNLSNLRLLTGVGASAKGQHLLNFVRALSMLVCSK